MQHIFSIALMVAAVLSAPALAQQPSPAPLDPNAIFHIPGQEDTLQFYWSFTAAELEQLIALDTALVMIDLRSPDQYAAGHILGSINMPAATIDPRYREFRRMQKQRRNMVLISEDGKLARELTAELLKKKLDRVWFLRGGIEAWVKSGRSLSPGQ
ncbi:MAG: rhodanese-like domain-containing protein [Chlorobi bacterium]|nr:rhodanese-like domain-containing protein [Chlorobiota bacterium]